VAETAARQLVAILNTLAKGSSRLRNLAAVKSMPEKGGLMCPILAKMAYCVRRRADR
jgi:hypothetical protein